MLAQDERRRRLQEWEEEYNSGNGASDEDNDGMAAAHN